MKAPPTNCTVLALVAALISLGGNQVLQAQSASRMSPEELSGPSIQRGPGANLGFGEVGPRPEPESDRLAAHVGRRRIMLTGYWPPSNDMLRNFSPRPQQNPNGWKGANWEGRGYDVYSFFPEFPDNPSCSVCGRGRGDLEVDYQDTSRDFWRLANAVKPVAIITFSRANERRTWEVEMNQFNRAEWFPDYRFPQQPTPAPPDNSVPAEFLRPSTLPINAIVDAVNAARRLNITAFPCVTQDGGGFLSEFVAYHGVWYQALHSSPQDLDRCVAAGHIHIGRELFAEGSEAAKITLRTVIDHVNSVLGAPGGSVTSCGEGGVDAGCGNPINILLANGGRAGRARTLYLGTSDPFRLTLREPPSRIGDSMDTRLCMYAFAGLPSTTDIVTLPKNLGNMCFGPASIATQSPLQIWNSIGSRIKLGRHTAPGPPPVIPDGGEVNLIDLPMGAGRPFTVTFQGIVEDNCSRATIPYSITNGISLIIE